MVNDNPIFLLWRGGAPEKGGGSNTTKTCDIFAATTPPVGHFSSFPQKMGIELPILHLT